MVEAWQLEMNGNENFGIDYHGEEAGLKLSISYQACVRVAQSYFSFLCVQHSRWRTRIMGVDLSAPLAWRYLKSLRKTMTTVNMQKIEEAEAEAHL